MKKFILFFVLSLLFVSFVAFLLNAFNLQKDYFESKNKDRESEANILVEEEDVKPSQYTDYSKEDYETAIKEKNILVIYFTSNWCQECIDQDAVNTQVFSEITANGVIGQRVHILDSESTTETTALAKKYDVTKEQSIVIVDKSGVTTFKHVGVLSKEMLTQKIMEVVNK